MNMIDVTVVVNSILNNENRVNKLRTCKTSHDLLKKAKSFAIGEARTQRIHFNEEEITECAYQLFKSVR